MFHDQKPVFTRAHDAYQKLLFNFPYTYLLQISWPFSRTPDVYTIILLLELARNSIQIAMVPWNLLSPMAQLVGLFVLQPRSATKPFLALNPTQN